jgi:hypothetical protein
MLFLPPPPEIKCLSHFSPNKRVVFCYHSELSLSLSRISNVLVITGSLNIVVVWYKKQVNTR